MLAALGVEYKGATAGDGAPGRCAKVAAMDGPSIAAIVVPWEVSVTRERVATALTSQGLLPRKEPLPKGYKPAPNEWVGLVYLALPERAIRRESWANTAIIPVDIARVFHLAMWFSKSHPDDLMVAWRRFSGFSPCAKILWGGKPRWKEGEDHDHEIGFTLPQSAPAELRPPGEARVPLTLEGLTPLLQSIVPTKDPWSQGGEGWLHRTSPIA